MPHGKKFVTSREIWTLYWLMLLGAFFWGGLWSLVAFLIFHFNHEALVFLSYLTIATGICAGLTTYIGTRRLLGRVEMRARNADLDLP